MKPQKTLIPDQMHANAFEAAGMLRLLANPTRLLILCHLAESSLNVGEIEDKVHISQSSLSQHLAKLRAQGLIQHERQGQQIYYSLVSMEVRALLSLLYLIYCK